MDDLIRDVGSHLAPGDFVSRNRGVLQAEERRDGDLVLPRPAHFRVHERHTETSVR